jgi:hypothetical protein
MYISFPNNTFVGIEGDNYRAINIYLDVIGHEYPFPELEAVKVNVRAYLMGYDIVPNLFYNDIVQGLYLSLN